VADIYNIFWTDAAAKDLQVIIDFIAQRNPERAGEISKRVQQQIGALGRFPFRSRLVPELKVIGLDFYREWIIEPYRVLLRIRGHQVIILVFFDGRRDLEEILFERLIRQRDDE